MKVLIISGFLGAGKTTFIKELSQRTKKKFVILENEYAALGMDGDILKDSTDKDNIWEMTKGCICCSKKGDFAASVLTIANTLDPEYLIIEPTGVGMLSKVLSHIKKVEYERIQILSPLTIVDGQSIDRYKHEFKQIYEDQIKSAGNILISKFENSSEKEISHAIKYLKETNPEANIFSQHYTTLSDKYFFDFLESPYDSAVSSDMESNADGENIDNFSLFDISLRHPTYLILLLESIIRGEYGHITRAKGNFNIDGINMKFDLYDTKYSIIVCDDTVSNGAVFIGKYINRLKLNKNFIKLKQYKSIKFRSY